jgi:hypothetical protein
MRGADMIHKIVSGDSIYTNFEETTDNTYKDADDVYAFDAVNDCRDSGNYIGKT